MWWPEPHKPISSCGNTSDLWDVDIDTSSGGWVMYVVCRSCLAQKDYESVRGWGGKMTLYRMDDEAPPLVLPEGAWCPIWQWSEDGTGGLQSKPGSPE